MTITTPLSRTSAQVTLVAARIAIAGAEREADRNGWHISVAVVDAAGEPVAFEKCDGAIGISPSVAFGKARTAALLQAPSGEFERFINNGQPSFLSVPGVTPLEGGLPIYSGSQVIGAIGVSGAHGPNDTQVAAAGVAALMKLEVL